MESTVLVFLVGLCVGVVLALLLYQAEIKSDLYSQIDNHFEKHLEVLPTSYLRRKVVASSDPFSPSRFGELGSNVYNKSKLLCVVFVQKRDNLIAINDTWIKHCNNILYYGNVTDLKNGGNSCVFIEHINSSWHRLCNVMKIASEKYVDMDWTLFVNDNMFVIPENIHYMVDALNSNNLYYMGHPMSMWGVDYNIASAGFIVSRGATRKIAKKFQTTNICTNDGHHWKDEDYYLGKVLNELELKPLDTRDENGLVTFMGYDLVSMMNPGSNKFFAKYYTNSLIPVKCCSHRAVTFQVTRASLMYTIYYATYKLKVYTGDNLGTSKHTSFTSDSMDFVWQQFLRDIGQPLNVTSEEYRKLWQIQIDKDAKNVSLTSSSNYNPFRFLPVNTEKQIDTSK